MNKYDDFYEPSCAADFSGLLARKANGFVLVGLYGPLCWENDLVGVRVNSLQPHEKYEAFPLCARGEQKYVEERREKKRDPFLGMENLKWRPSIECILQFRFFLLPLHYCKQAR